jgi:hypothetical protein
MFDEPSFVNSSIGVHGRGIERKEPQGSLGHKLCDQLSLSDVPSRGANSRRGGPHFAYSTADKTLLKDG